MKLFVKLTIICLVFLVLLTAGLLPSFAAAGHGPAHRSALSDWQTGASLSYASIITFTPVATFYLPVVVNNTDTTPPAVKITRIEYDPDGIDAEGEYVDVRNFGTMAVDLTGWILQDEAETKYIFPSFSLPSQATVRVWVKSGTDNAKNLYWGRNSATWNNTGDTASLRNAMNMEVDSCTYAGGAPGFVTCE